MKLPKNYVQKTDWCQIDFYIAILEKLSMKKMYSGSYKNVNNKTCLQIIYI